MSLLPRQTDSELARIAEERWARRRGLVVIPPAVAELVLPVTIVLPWSALCSDNIRHTVGGGIQPRLVLEARYRDAKRKTATIARALVGEVRAVAFPLALHAQVWVPDNRPHDVCNLAKCCADALEGVVYVKDRWLYDVRWTRAGVCVDAPRAEVTISDMGLR